MKRQLQNTDPIYFDCRQYGASGIGTYIENLIGQYSSIAQDLPIELLVRKEHLDYIKAISNFEAKIYDDPIYSIREQFKWVTKLKSKGLLHVPHYNAPLFYPGQMITTVHDICHLAQKQFFPGVMKRIYSNQFLQQVLKRSNHIITDSNFTKSEIIKYFGTPEEKIHVIYLGVDSIFKPLPYDVTQKVLDFHGLPKEYILFIGNIKPHKNILGLLTSYKIALEQNPDLPPLVILGQFKNLITGIPNLKEIIKDKTFQSNIIFTGYLPTKDLPAIYSRAMLFLFPSFYEGFGLPPIEAMACGAPVITSNVSSIPEVLEDAAVMVDPYDSDMIADRILTLASDTQMQEDYRQRGIKHVEKFSWEKSAIEHLRIFKMAHENIPFSPTLGKSIPVEGKTNILFLDQFGDRIGGGQIILLDILEKFRDSGLWNIFISVPTEGSFTELLKQKGFSYWCVPSWEPKEKQSNLSDLSGYLFSSVKNTHLLSKKVKENNIQAVYCNGGRTFLSGSFLSFMYPLEVFWHLHLILDSQQKKAVTTFGRLPAVKSIIAVSKTLMQPYTEDNISKKIYTVANWVSPKLFFSKRNPRKLQFDGSLKIGIVGLICQAKGQWTIIDSLLKTKEVLPFEFHFYGRPLESETKQWKKFLKNLELLNKRGWNVCHEGFESDPMKMYNNIDILIIPSIVPEAFGLTAIEAMNREVIVVSNRSGALLEIIQDKINGFLYDVFKPKELPGILKDIADGHYPIDEIRKAGVRTVEENYHPETQLNKIHDLVKTRVLPYHRLENDQKEST